MRDNMVIMRHLRRNDRKQERLNNVKIVASFKLRH